MMPEPGYVFLLLTLLTALLGSLVRMGVALDEANIEGFVIWTGIAAAIAFTPSAL